MRSGRGRGWIVLVLVLDSLHCRQHHPLPARSEPSDKSDKSDLSDWSNAIECNRKQSIGLDGIERPCSPSMLQSSEGAASLYSPGQAQRSPGSREHYMWPVGPPQKMRECVPPPDCHPVWRGHSCLRGRACSCMLAVHHFLPFVVPASSFAFDKVTKPVKSGQTHQIF